MQNVLNTWRYYTLGREQYNECMRKTFHSNLYSLRQANTVVVVLGICFTLVPIVFEKDFRKAGIYLAAIIIAILLAVFANHRYRQLKQGKQIGDLHIRILTAVYYANIILFGIYIGVWSNPDGPAVSFMTFLICAFFLFINPPLYNLLLTLGAMSVFITSTVLVKGPQNWIFDIFNVLIAGSLSLFFSWQITRLRLAAALNASKLENERNSYYDQSTIDELTQLKNRRDFMQTFQRRLTHYRSTDDWLCIALMDIDFFKDYNDHYGHPQGDECLRAIGKALNSLRESMNVYAARVGGEEFALIWYEKDRADLHSTVSRIQQTINDLNIPHVKSKVAPHVTVSIGIHVIRCGASDDMQALYDLSDRALYTAKRSGRNRAVVHDEVNA